jgi:hypothetical protein
MVANDGEFLGKSQYKIGNILFGDNTNMPVSKVEIQPWNVNNQDFQVIHSDEVRFGIDNLVPAPIVFTMAVLNNWALENVPGGGSIPPGLIYQARSLLGQLANEWKATETRQTWGAMKKLLFVDTDGIRRRVYGRPGKFQHGPVEQNEWVDVQAEFRRADTLAYDDTEKVIEIGYNENPTYIHREVEQGDAPAWFRVLFYGPLTHPTVTIGKVQIELGIDILPDTIVEVSSYPWMRRIVDSNGINWRASLIGSSQYLDQLQIPPDEDIALRWTDQTLTTWTSLDSNVMPTNFDFLDMFNLGVTGGWHTLMGTPIWGFSLENGGYLWAPFGTCAIIDNLHTYQTDGQFIQSTIADIWRGSTTVCFKAQPDLSNFAGFEIVKTLGILEEIGIPTANDKLRIVTGGLGSSYNILYEYAVPSPGLKSGDDVACAYDNNTDMLYLFWNGVGLTPNGVSAAGGVGTGKKQGFVLNQDDSITNLSFGVGINNTIAYDAVFDEPGPPGDPNDLSSRVFLYWRDAWSIE